MQPVFVAYLPGDGGGQEGSHYRDDGKKLRLGGFLVRPADPFLRLFHPGAEGPVGFQLAIGRVPVGGREGMLTQEPGALFPEQVAIVV